jgi:hypothetical protein
MRVSTSRARNVAAGLLTGAAVSLWLTMILLAEVWARAAPNATEQLLYRHKGVTAVGYLSAFQATGLALSPLAFPLFFIGYVIAPKNINARRGLLSWSFTFDPDGPETLILWSQLAGVLLALATIFALGPALVRFLNSSGIVLSMG